MSYLCYGAYLNEVFLRVYNKLGNSLTLVKQALLTWLG